LHSKHKEDICVEKVLYSESECEACVGVVKDAIEVLNSIITERFFKNGEFDVLRRCGNCRKNFRSM